MIKPINIRIVENKEGKININLNIQHKDGYSLTSELLTVGDGESKLECIVLSIKEILQYYDESASLEAETLPK